MKKFTITDVKKFMKGVFGLIKGLLKGDIEVRKRVYAFNITKGALYVLATMAVSIWVFVIASVLHFLDCFTMSDNIMLIGAIYMACYIAYCAVVFKYCEVDINTEE
jgi:hypothetical protein